jgi:hypothetical protein
MHRTKNAGLFSLHSLLMLFVSFHATTKAFHSARTFSTVPCESVYYARGVFDDDTTAILAKMEEEVLASAQARTDSQRVLQALFTKNGGDNIDDVHITKIDNNLLNELPSKASSSPVISQWKIALAAACVASVSCYTLILRGSLVAAGFVFVVTFGVANTDPLADDTLGGALARLVGRSTLQSLEASRPKAKAVARALVVGQDEIQLLRQELRQAQQEISVLRLWKEQRLFVDEALSRYSLEELKDQARANRIAVGGTKTQLLIRLVQANVIKDSDD